METLHSRSGLLICFVVGLVLFFFMTGCNFTQGMFSDVVYLGGLQVRVQVWSTAQVPFASSRFPDPRKPRVGLIAMCDAKSLP